MFIETHSDNGLILTFIKSTNVQAYPCGRRRSTTVDKDGKSDTVNDKYYFPFDPEARLNTEANNRKHSSLNGFTQTYLKDWDREDDDTKATKHLYLVLAGYFFDITLTGDYTSESDFGRKVIENLINKATEDKNNATINGSSAAVDNAQAVLNTITNTTRIYANILIEDAHLFSGFKEYYTGVLRNQSADLETSLDLLNSNTSASGTFEAKKDFNNFYFSGLSFSATPFTEDPGTRSQVSQTIAKDGFPNGRATQQIVSLCILEKVDSEWKIHEPARLPKIEHGTTEDSIVIAGNTLIKSDLTVSSADSDNPAVTTLDKAIVRSTLEVTNTNNNAELLADNARVTSADITSLKAYNIGNADNKVENIITKVASVDTLTAGTINANDVQQMIGDDYCDVPVIFVEPQKSNSSGKTEYQLKISRAVQLTEKQVN